MIHHQILKLNSKRFTSQPITLLTAVDHVKRGLVYFFVCFARHKNKQSQSYLQAQNLFSVNFLSFDGKT